MQAITIEQWNALRQQGHSDQVIAQHYTIAQAAPTAPAIPNATQPQRGYDSAPCGAPDLGGASYGVTEGRAPEEGRHVVRVLGSERKRTQQMYPMGATFIRFVILESSNPENEIGGEYSKAYSHNPADGFGRPLDDLKGWITQVIEHKRPDLQPRARWENAFSDLVSGPDQLCADTVWVLRTESRKGTRGRDFVKFDWGKGVVPEGTRLQQAPAVPTLTAPPMPAPQLPPPMPGAVPPMPAPQLPPSIQGGVAHGAGPKPAGWMGAWPPGSDGGF